MGTFAQEFMKIYDRKIQSGEITFSRSGINGGDFTALCINPAYVIPEDRLKIIFEKIRAGRTMDELKDAPISLIMEESYPVVTESTPISSVTAMMSDCNAVLVARKGKLVGMITKADILKLI